MSSQHGFSESLSDTNINIKDLIPEEARHTISLFVDYLSEQALCAIYSYNWVSNRDEYLRGILLYDNVQPYLHNFLLKNVEKIHFN